jgi:Zn finger protein HypA/HybF involved in hydrogenase expression
MDYTGYCVKCKKKNVKMEGPKLVPMKGKGKVKRYAISGSCPTCSTKMFRIVGKEAAENFKK